MKALHLRVIAMADWLDDIRAAKQDAIEAIEAKKETERKKDVEKGRDPSESIDEIKNLILPLFKEVKNAIGSSDSDYPKLTDKSYVIPQQKRRGAQASYAYYTVEFELSRLPIKMSRNPLLTVHVDIGAQGWRAVRASTKIVNLPTELQTTFETSSGAKRGAVVSGVKKILSQFVKSYYELVKKRST